MINDQEATVLRKKFCALEARLNELNCEREVALQSRGVTLGWLRVSYAEFAAHVSPTSPLLVGGQTLLSALKQKRPELRRLSDLSDEVLLDYVEPLCELGDYVLAREAHTRKVYAEGMDQLSTLLCKLEALDKSTLEPKVDL